MPSIQTKIIKKIMIRRMMGMSVDTPIEDRRTRLDAPVKFINIPANTHCQPVDADGIPAEWAAPPHPKAGALFYLHGGAYALGSIVSHRTVVARLAHATGLRGFAISYRLAPEHPHPAALEDALTAYRWLLSNGVTPAQLIVVGDSAGGGLALALMAALRDAGDPLPAGVVCLSPWADLTNSSPSFQSKAVADFVLSHDVLEAYANDYVGDQDRKSPLISPLFADFSGFPPLLIHVGTDEVLLDDSIRVADRARAAGVDVSLTVWEGLFHVFPVVPFLPESKKVMKSIAEFAASCRSILQN